MESIWQDVRFGFRMLMKHRLASLVCVVALALGIGANAAMFSLAEAFLLHPVPFENGNRIVALVDGHTRESGAGFGQQDFVPIAPATYFDWKKEAHSFDQITAYAWNEVNLTGDREPQKLQAFHVPANFFETIGVQPSDGARFLAGRGRSRQGTGDHSWARAVGAALCLRPEHSGQERESGWQELYRCRRDGQGL